MHAHVRCVDVRRMSVRAAALGKHTVVTLAFTHSQPSACFEDIVVDDRFPTKWGQCSFAKSGKKSEAWVQVIELLGSPWSASGLGTEQHGATASGYDSPNNRRGQVSVSDVGC